MSAPRWEIAFTVDPADIDEMGHVNNVVYLRWVQDVAIAHWKAVASPAAQAEFAWVAVRHEIDYEHAAVQGDAILVRTWVGPTAGITFERHTEIFRATDRRRLAKARTLWCPVDARTGRARRASADVRAQFSVADDKST